MKNLWIFLSLLLLAGCGSKETVYSDAEGNTVKTDNQGNVTVTTREGDKVEVKSDGDTYVSKDSEGNEATITKSGTTVKNEKGDTFASGDAANVTEDDLGVPFYPGSQVSQMPAARAETAENLTVSSTRMTSDTPDKVIAFYKPKLKESQDVSSNVSGSQMASVSGKLEDGSEIVVAATRDQNAKETQVTITRVKQK